MVFLSVLLISMFITIALIPLLMTLGSRFNLMDIPDERKVHASPMPRTGGIAMALGAFIPVLFWAPADDFIRAVLIGGGILVLSGLIDDWRNLDYKIKFAAQTAAALIVIFYGGVKITSLGMLLPEDMLLPDLLAVPLTVFVIVGVTNAINLADGLDGLAGGISLLSFICLVYLAYGAEQTVMGVLAVAVAGSIFGFLRFNTYPAVVFMGDAGSQFLGFSAITLSLGLTQGNTPLSPLLPLLILGFPVLDTLTVMLERLAEKKSPFFPDKKHFHHRLIRVGLSHTESVLVIYFLQACLIISAIFFRFHSDWLLLILYVIFSGIVLAGFFLADRTGWRFRRYNLLDKVIKGKLKALKENIIISVCFRGIEYGIPALLLFICIIPQDIPVLFSLLSLGLAALMAGAWFFKKKSFVGALRLALYVVIPLLIFQGETGRPGWMSEWLTDIYNFIFVILVVFIMLTLRLSRRKAFKSTPMDFLILFIALVVPNLPHEPVQNINMGLIAGKIIVLFFGYEVLIGELRGELNRLGLATIAALAVLSVKGFII
ncbi:MAG: MraY family glycosyltransferase [Thermodesulfobacteriota bacterium]|nr:MraY family glycosyltransferase [Thermodesulfobacteriota bacterium]